MEDRLIQAVKNIKAGNKEKGKALLLELLQVEPENDKAWVWMSAVVETDDLRRECLEEALLYNPFNETAQRGLDKLKRSRSENDSVDQVPESANQENWSYIPPPMQPQPQPREVTQSYDPQEPLEAATSYVIKELARFTRKADIANKLAVTGMNYDAAFKFVNDIEATKRREIELRRLPIVIALSGVLTFMGGIWTASIFWVIAQGGIPSPLSFFFGVPMFVSGIVGLVVSVYKIAKG